jgi:lipopolysaccharide assembly outer membrane protein LptD (OstA)
MSSLVPLSKLPVLFILPCLFVLAFMSDGANADAFLSDDKVYYGADSYSVDYEKKIVNAVGHAFFRKEKRRVDADRIVIHYAENRKTAYCYGNVVLSNSADGSKVTGDYAEARYREEYYFMEGDAVYSDGERRIAARRIESRKDEEYFFQDDVRYKDDSYAISAASLSVTNDTALFKGDTAAVHIESGDSVSCDEIIYDQPSEDVTFSGRALYIEHEGDNSLVIRSDVMRYFKDTDLFVLVGNVSMMNGSYTLRASVARYRRTKKLLEAEGDIVVWDGKKYVYSDNLEYDVRTDRVVFFKEVRGVFSPKGKS